MNSFGKKINKFFDKFQKKEVVLFKNSNWEITLKPFYAYQGLAVFTIVFIALATISNILYLQKLNTSTIKTAIQKQNTTIVASGLPVEWTTLVKRSDINNGKYLLKLPKDAHNIKISGVDKQQALAIISSPISDKLPFKNRASLALAKMGGGSALALTPQAKQTNLFDISIEGQNTVTTEINGAVKTTPVVQTKDAVMIDLSQQVLDNSTSPEEFVRIEYQTQAPNVTEKLENKGKIVTVSAFGELPENPLKNVLAFSNIAEIYKTTEKNRIQIRWKNNKNLGVSFQAYDLNKNGYIDYVEWTVPHLSEQQFEIIFISNALKLDSQKNIVSDIYNIVKDRDNKWELLKAGEYIDVKFKKALERRNDISIYAKADAPAKIEVYAEDNSLLATFNNVQAERKYTIFLNKLRRPTNTFYLKILGDVQINQIIDPASPCGGTPTDGLACSPLNENMTACGLVVNTCVGSNDNFNCIAVGSPAPYTCAELNTNQAGCTSTGCTWDNTAPTTTASASGGYIFGTITASMSVDVTLTCSDAGSGCASTYYCTDATNTCTPVDAYAPISITAEGPTYIRYYSVDNYGNEGAVAYSIVKIRLDTTAPSISYSGATPADSSSQVATSATIATTSSDSSGEHSVVNNFDSSLVGWWRMDTLSGATVVDYINANNGTRYGTAVDQVPTMTNSVTPSGVTSASSVLDNSAINQHYLAFDNDAGTKWHSAVGDITGDGAWLQYQFPEPKIITSYTMTQGGNEKPKNWTLNGSNNGTDWDVIDTRTDITNWVNPNNYTISSPGSYLFYRIIVTATGNAQTYCQIGELEMFSTGPTQTDFGKFGKSLSLNGTSDYLTIANTNLPSGTSAHSGFAWVKTSYNTSEQYILQYGTAGGTHGAKIGLSLSNGGGDNVYFSGYYNDCNITNTGIFDGAWHQVGYTYAGGSATEVYIYVDGVGTQCSLSEGALNVTLDANNYIGAGDDLGTGVMGFFNGQLDNVQIYNRSLSSGEISALYDANVTQYSNSFTGLAVSSHTSRSYAEDLAGNITDAGLRTFSVITADCSGLSNCSSHGTCIGIDVCTCDANYYLDDCSTLCEASTTCTGNGTCDANGACVCSTGWTGGACNTCATNYYPTGTCNVQCIAASTCNGNGTCDANGACSCTTGWQGDSTCSVFSCDGENDCSGHGTCTGANTCTCNSHYSGTDCSSIDATSPVISFSGSTPANNSSQLLTFATITSTSSDNSGEHSIVNDFDSLLTGWWRFNLGEELTDSSSNVNNGTNNGATWTSDGKYGGAYTFNGTSNYITIPNMDLATITVSAWVKRSADSLAGAPFQSIVGPASGAGWSLYFGDDTCASMDDLAWTKWGGAITCSTGTVADQNWHMVSVTMNATNSCLYIDGTLDHCDTNVFTPNASSALYRIGYNSGGLFGGSIDDVQIYNRALSAGEISAIYNANSTPYSKIFTDLAVSSHTSRIYTQDLAGNVANTALRTFNVTNGADGTSCTTNVDCVSGVCTSSICRAVTESDYTLINTSAATSSASTTSGLNTSANAFDGDTNTYWSSSSVATDNNLTLDLGSENTKIVTMFRLYHSDSTLLAGTIQGSNDNSTWTDLATFTHTTASQWFNTAVDNSTSYQYYRLTFSNNTPSGNWVRVNEWEIYEPLVVGVINTPSNLTATQSGNDTIVLTWNSNSNPAGTTYYAENITKSINSGWISATTWSSTGLPCEASYSFRVKAQNSDGESAYTGTVTATTGTCPAGGGGGAGVGQAVATAITTPVTTVIDTITQITQAITPTTEPVIKGPTVDTVVTQITPTSLTTPTNIITPINLEPIKLPPLPTGLQQFVDKFPTLASSLEQSGLLTGNDITKLKVSEISMPTIADVINASTSVPLSAMTQEEKTKIPTEVVFAKSGDELIDLGQKISANQSGSTYQKINTVINNSIQLIVKPNHPVTSIKGYITFVSRKTQPSAIKTQTGALANALAMIQPDIAKAAEDANTFNSQLLIKEFEYEDSDQDGIYTASIDTPMASGQYNITSILDYQDPQLESKELKMTTLVDPEGYIYQKSGDQEIRINNATVTLYWLNPATQKYEIWKASDYNQDNPQNTGKQGNYSFLVPVGSYYIKVESGSYITHQTQPFEVKEGSGIHTNIELQPKHWWMKTINWEITLLILAIALLLIDFFKDNIYQFIKSKFKKENLSPLNNA